MSIHPSLKVDTAGTQQRSVLTRIERIKELMRKGLWAEQQSVTGLPKTKIVRIKARKAVKEEKPAEGAAAGASAEGAAAAPAAGAKGKEAAKPAAKK